MSRAIGSAALACVMAAVLSDAVHAGFVEVSWTGTITSSSVAEISIGGSIAGSFTYDDTTPAFYVSPPLAIYNTGHVSSFSVNGLSGSQTGSQINVFDNNTWRDQFDSRPTSGSTYSGDLIGGSTVTQIFVVFSDSTKAALSDLSLPLMLQPADFDNLAFSRLDLASRTSVLFHIDHFEFSRVSAVPEPSCIALFGMGVASLCGCHWGRKRHQAA